MSQRVKRPNRSDDGSVPVKRRKRPTAEEEEAATLAAVAWQPRSNDLKSIYNRTTTEAPAELFRKDLISAMKLPDSEPLASNEYWVIVDQWKQEWERGVQVPVNPESLPEPSVTECSPIKPQQEFKLPKNKYIRITKDDNFKVDDHVFSNAPAQAEAACSYDLDECDVSWLKLLNTERAMSGLSAIHEDQLERVIEQFELSCWDKIQSILRCEEGLGIEYDENVICDVCRSPDSEEGNEMVFCDSCNICVHQACYGITRIPEGQWLCCTCNLSKRPKCVLCPNKGGAMKCTRSGQKWAHVSCALWIPEVSIGCVEKMEPITKISSIPASRWALICVLCRERVGACIQCSVKTCKTAYHVTCAFKHGLEMRAIIEDENADDGVKLRSYCEKHSKSSKKEKSVCSGSEDDDSKRKKRKDMTSEEKNQARAARLQEIEAEFHKHVSIKDITIHSVDNDALHYIYNYWKLKRRAGHNKPLLPPKSEDVDMLSHKREQADLEKMKMFVQLRQDLERVRNLCYMVSRREKLSRSFFRLREQTFHKQVAVLESAPNLSSIVVQSVIEANHGPSIYDRLYSHSMAPDHTTDFAKILAHIDVTKSPTTGDEKPELNGLLFKDYKNNPYKKVYFNGTTKRRSGSLYGSSTSNSSSDERNQKDNKENRFHNTSSEEDEKPTVSTTNLKKKSTGTPSRKTNNNNNKTTERRRKRLSQASSRSKIGSSSEDDKPTKKELCQFSRSRLMQVEKELGYSASDSDDLVTINTSKKADAKTISSIYSDSDDSSDVAMKKDDDKSSSNAASDSQQNRLRTKAAVKEFSHKPSTSKSPNKSSPDNKKKIKNDTKKENSNKKKNDYVASDLIVPQRQAAKKATENLKSTTTNKVATTATTTKDSSEDNNVKVEEKIKTPISSSKPKTKSSSSLLSSSSVKEMVKETTKEKKNKDRDKDDKQSVDIFDIDKEMDGQEILAYVPQRQAAKKAAEHIKSGLGKPAAPLDQSSSSSTTTSSVANNESDGKIKTKDIDLLKAPKAPAKIPETKRKSSSNSSSSSSSSSSSDSSTSSSSDSDDESPTPSAQKTLSQQPRSEGLFSNHNRDTTNKRTVAKDWPFLDKGAKPKASSSSSSSSDSSRSPSPRRKSATTTTQSKTEQNKQQQQQSNRKISSDKSKQIQQQQQQQSATSATQRDEQARQRGRGRPASRGRPRTPKSGDQFGDANVRVGTLFDSNEQADMERIERDNNRKQGKSGSSWKGKQEQLLSPSSSSEKESSTKSSSKLQSSPIRKTEKNKLNETNLTSTTITSEHEVSTLEKEILERKAGSKQGAYKTKLDKLFGSPDKKMEKEEKSKSPNKQSKPLKTDKLTNKSNQVKENKEPVVEARVTLKKSPIKNKNIDEIFAQKSTVSNENNITIKDSPKRVEIAGETTNKDMIKYDTTTTSDHHQLMHSHLEHDNVDKKNSMKSQQAPAYQSRSIFSPPHIKDNFLDFDNLDDGFGLSKDDEAIKTPLVFNFTNSRLFKEDTKEDSARETLNLVEKLRLKLSKKSTSSDVDDGASVSSSRIETDRLTTISAEFNSDSIRSNNSKEIDHKDEPIVIKDDENHMEFNTPLSTAAPTIITSSTPTRTTQATNVNLEMRLAETSKGFIQDDRPRSRDDYRYINCDADIPIAAPPLPPPLSSINNIPPVSLQQQQNHGLSDHHGVTAQGDERWVPPSNDTYLNEPPPAQNSYVNDVARAAAVAAAAAQHYLQQQYSKATSVLPPPPQLDIIRDKTQSPIVQRISQTPLIDPQASMDCMPSPSYSDVVHPQAKWAESELMPNRRSSSSSAASTSSSCSRRNEDEDIRMRPDVVMVNHQTLENMYHSASAATIPPYPPNPLDNFQPFPETNPYMNSVSLFPSSNLNTPLAFPPTGPPVFQPPFGAPFPAPPHSILPQLPPKPVDAEQMPPYSSTCTATFTSSQHNMALTAAMVNLPPSIPKDMESPAEEDISTPNLTEPPVQPDEAPTPSPLAPVNTTPTTMGNVLSSPSPSIKSNSSAGKKSPSKPTRTSARVTSQLNKSPSKSPGKSPRQQSEIKSSGVARGGRGEARRNSVKSGGTTARSQSGQARGRGRGRGRGKSIQHHNDYDINTIHNKLVGTVYDLDFDEDISNDNMTDLKSMRERRKSVDLHDRKLDHGFVLSKESSASPKFASPSQQKSQRSYNADLRELRPPTPVEQLKPPKLDPIRPIVENEQRPHQHHGFAEMVQPVLPGPVDMRTYNTNFDQQAYNETNLLSVFASGTAEPQVHEEIDEDFEKELQSAITATSNKKQEEPPSHVPTSEVGNIKVSLSDSRNQLKVKIKGPIANYSSTIAPLPVQPTVDPIVVTNINSVSNNAISNNSMAASSGGTSNLRRMRKKELLRQYCAQDMNMGETVGGVPFNTTMPTVTPVNRTIITIPKAVASMTSIPTKDDYRDYRTGSDDLSTSDTTSKQSRKETKSRAGMRELRQLDMSLDEHGMYGRRGSISSISGTFSATTTTLSTSFDSSLANKRRGRPPRSSSQQPGATPKIKIKIGNSIAGSGSGLGGGASMISAKIDDRKDRIRPPKKRLATINMPSVEDLKRESMKFRKMVMADFGEEKEKKKKKDKSEKRKRKKSKADNLFISNETQNPTKLIIRIGKKIDGDSDSNNRTTNNENCISSVVANANNSANANVEKVEKKSSIEEAKMLGLVPEIASSTASTSATPLGDGDGDAPKMTPIKLKLSRCQEGSGYVMKQSTPIQPSENETKSEEVATQPGQPPPISTSSSLNTATAQIKSSNSPPTPISLPEGVHQPPTPLPLNKDCEVR